MCFKKRRVSKHPSKTPSKRELQKQNEESELSDMSSEVPSSIDKESKKSSYDGWSSDHGNTMVIESPMNNDDTRQHISDYQTGEVDYNYSSNASQNRRGGGGGGGGVLNNSSLPMTATYYNVGNGPDSRNSRARTHNS